MIAEIGHFALILALGVAAFQCLVPLIGAQRRNREMIASMLDVAPAALTLVLIYGPLPRSPMPMGFLISSAERF